MLKLSILHMYNIYGTERSSCRFMYIQACFLRLFSDSDQHLPRSICMLLVWEKHVWVTPYPKKNSLNLLIKGFSYLQLKPDSLHHLDMGPLQRYKVTLMVTTNFNIFLRKFIQLHCFEHNGYYGTVTSSGLVW